MKKVFFVLYLFICSIFLNAQTLTQISTIDALLAGYYDGVMPLEKLLTYGDFGIGTFDKLDGEMIVLDGVIYQFKSDGKLYKAQLTDSTPFASVVHFKSKFQVSVKSVNSYNDFQKIIDNKIENINLLHAVKVTGKFSYMKTRTVPAQQKPYKPLAEVTKTQPIFEKNNQEGLLVGFLLPSYTAGINVPGYHLHFISSDFSFGGHVLEFIIDGANVEIQEIREFKMILPEDSEFGAVDLKKNRTEELHQVEK